MGLIELILKDRHRLERVIRDPSLSAELFPRFLAIALAGFTLFGMAAAIVIGSLGVWPRLTAIDAVLSQKGSLIEFVALSGSNRLVVPWFDGAAFQLIFAYDIGLIAAAGICLPSLYFYGLLAGVRMTMLDVVIHTIKAMATTAVALVGILPIYVAMSLGVSLLPRWDELIGATLELGLILPFVAGFFGLRSLYFGFAGLCDSLPVERRFRRACFLRRLVLSWAACYSAVTPVMIFTLWEYLSRG